MDLFDPEIALSERMRAAEMLYARCMNPLDFWLQALPRMPAMQVSVRQCGSQDNTKPAQTAQQ